MGGFGPRRPERWRTGIQLSPDRSDVTHPEWAFQRSPAHR